MGNKTSQPIPNSDAAELFNFKDQRGSYCPNLLLNMYWSEK